MEKALTGLVAWIDARLPLTRAWNTHMGEYYAPKNFNLWYFFGVFSLLVLVNQLLTGIWLTMNYTPSAEEAFASVEYIMRDVDYGWLLRYMHSTGASAFFIVVYLHMMRALMYGSYKKPRELIWIFGMLIFIVLMAEAFVGYVLPWGQMSYWGAQVIISLFGAIPVVGEDIVTWIRGDYLISGITLNRFFALQANGLKTPEHIAPVWYFTPFYSVLRAVPDKFWGFVFFAISVVIPFALPWLDRNPVRSWRYRGLLNRVMLLVFVASFIILGVLGVKAPTPERTILAQICTIFYFLFFLAMPWWSRLDRTKPEPERVTMDGGMGFWKGIGTVAIVGALAFLPLKVVGAESAYNCGTMSCDPFEADAGDKPSLQRGAALYANYCMGCHSLQYSRHNRVARDLGIPEDLYKANLVFDPEIKLGSLMTNSMDKAEAKKWFGATPPDLTLISRARQPEWLYTYLRAFYQDESRPYGVNNRVYPNVGMPHVLMELQGLSACFDVSGAASAKAEQCATTDLVSAGAMSPEQFDGAVYDLVNFLAYTAEPFKADRIRIGTYVLLFLVVFFIFAWLLNREYWKDVH
ncbi:MAG: ubiquinol-cytochrome c reductase [Gammaproteobacteria bacterium]|nr:ubiquinol-cytochrome c reductase [Gammaproteobacteria bacterium]